MKATTDRPLLVYDANIADVETYFSPYATVRAFADKADMESQLMYADALLVSSQTAIDQTTQLGTTRFIGTPTAGFNHINAAIRQNPSYEFAHAPGANAQAVADYVLASIAEMHYPITQSTNVGIIGFGLVGRRVADSLRDIVGTICAFDPLVTSWQQSRQCQHVQPVDLQTLLNTSDIVTIHCHLHADDPHPSYHLLQQEHLACLKPQSTLINTARGEVIEPQALACYLQNKRNAVLDVWHNEPHLNPADVAAATIATPHIAGYTIAAKQEALLAVRKQFCQFFSLVELTDAEDTQQKQHSFYRMVYNADELLSQAVRIVDIQATSRHFKYMLQDCQHTHTENTFLSIRKNYGLRPQVRYER